MRPTSSAPQPPALPSAVSSPTAVSSAASDPCTAHPSSDCSAVAPAPVQAWGSVSTQPRRSAQAARAVTRAAAFFSSSSFLPADPTKNCWHFHDARDGRVLLSPGATTTTTCFSSFPYLVVYDPLYHKHVQIPPIPKDDIVAQLGECQFKPFLVPAAGADDDDDLSFRVMCNVLSKDMEYHYVVETFDYSSVSGVASLSDADYEPLSNLFYCMEHHYAHGCFYWVDSYGEACRHARA